MISDKGYIRFSTSPIAAIRRFFEIKTKGTKQPMYLPWELEFSGDILIHDFGVRNVICTDGSEDIPEHSKWRTDVLNVDSHDFECLRERKIRGKTFNFSSLLQGEIIVITSDVNSSNHSIIEFDMKFTPYVSHCTGSIEEDWNEEFIGEWKSISIDKLGIDNLLDDFATSGVIISQETGEDMMKKLISETSWNLLTKE